MALRMAQPWIHPTSKIIYLRQRTPGDMQHLVGTKVRLPVGTKFKHATIHRDVVQLSLETKEPAEGKERHARADAALRAFWAKNRQERELEIDSDGIPAPTPTMGWNTAVDRFASGASQGLADMGVPDTDANRAAVIAATASIWDRVAANLQPKFAAALVGPRPGSTAASTNSRPEASPGLHVPDQITVEALWDRFRKAKEGVLAPSSLRRYGPILTSLSGFCGPRDIKTITDDDIYAWAEYRRDEDDILPRVINRVDLAAVKSVLGWATTHQGGKLLNANPAEGIRLDGPRHQRTREASFRDAEVRTILTAARNIEVGGDNPSFARAKRWCPWLAAYSGARIAELTNLDAEDIWQERGIWVMHFAETKTRMPRTVPLHEHLIEQGFTKMRDEIGSGPLFYDPNRTRKPNATFTPADLRAQDIATWVRDVAKLDPEVDPNHGWRHTFKSRALDIIDQRIRDHIVGHIPTTTARRYEHPDITAVAAAMARFPRYTVVSDKQG
jgi:integrase